LAQGRDEGHAQGLSEGKEQGLAEGEAKARGELVDEMATQREVFENAARALHEVLADAKQFFDPVKRLAMHIAEQIVVGELQTSSKAIERLVQRCLDEMDHPVQGAVVLELNPQDKALLQEQAADFIKGMRLEAMHDMPRGSVRVFANDMVIEDLVEHRLESLAKTLLMDVDAWREQSTLMQPVLEVQEEVGGDDVHS
jgi:flagellar biosynthesis/type III secretory pathway protein FliH